MRKSWRSCGSVLQNLIEPCSNAHVFPIRVQHNALVRRREANLGQYAVVAFVGCNHGVSKLALVYDVVLFE